MPGAALARYILRGRTADQIDAGPFASKLLRYPIRDTFFAMPIPFGNPIWLYAPSVPRIYWAGLQTFEADVVPVFLQLCRSASYFADIGANAGVFSLLALRANPKLRIVAVEPNPRLASILGETIRRNNAPINLVDQAISDHSGKAQLSMNEGLSSIVAQRWGGAEVVDVSTVSFDELVGVGVDLVKIDAEGAELLILDGMRGSLEHARPHIIIELAAESVAPALAIAQAHGYVLRSLPHLVVCDVADRVAPMTANFLLDPCGGDGCLKVMTRGSVSQRSD